MASYRAPARMLHRIQILFVLAVVIPVNVAGWYAYFAFSRQLDNELTGRLFAIGAQTAEDLSQQMAFAETRVTSKSLNELLGDVLEERLKQSDVVRLFLTEPDAKPLLAVSFSEAIIESTDFVELDRDAIESARRGDYVSTRGTLAGVPVLRVYVPVWGGFNEITGVLGVEDTPSYTDALLFFRRALIAFGPVSGILAVLLIVLTGRMVRRALDLDEHMERTSRGLAMGRMTSSVAHEIRNPVGIISTNAQVLARHEDESVREIAQDIREETSRLGQIIQRFLDLSEPQTHFRPFNLKQVVAQAVNSVKRENGNREIEWSESYHDGDSTVEGDPDRLMSVIVNVIDNAVQAIPGKGRIQVSTAMENGQLLVSIADSGEGMDPKTLRSAREPFFTRKPQGTGLGLAIADRVILEHGGRLEITSMQGEGTSVEIRLPLKGTDTEKE